MKKVRLFLASTPLALLKISLLCFLSMSSFVHAECVILLHGLARTDSSLTTLQSALEQQGYVVVNQRYPSTKMTIEALSASTINQALTYCPSKSKVSFVTHSMGGIVVRYYLSQHELPRLRSVVMLAPPNTGSEVVDQLREWDSFRWINGPAGLQLGTDSKSLVVRLGPVDYSVGIIAGNQSVNPILSSMIPGVDDGKVAVERTKLEGMRDHIVMPVTHPFIMNSEKVIEQVLHFLSMGEFYREAD